MQLYADDFLKIDPSGKLGKLFMAIPAQLSRNASRYSPNSVVWNTDDEKEQEMIISLEDSKTVLVAYHTNDPNAGMSLSRDISATSCLPPTPDCL